VIGLDPASAMLRELRRRDRRFPVVRGDAHDLPFDDGAFEAVFFLTTLEFLPDPGRALQEAVRVARSDIVVLWLNPWSLGAIARRCAPGFLLSQARRLGLRQVRAMLLEAAGARADGVEWSSAVFPWPIRRAVARAPWGDVLAIKLQLVADREGGKKADFAEPQRSIESAAIAAHSLIDSSLEEAKERDLAERSGPEGGTMHHVTGIFSDVAAAERAVHDLVEQHFNPDDVSILVSDARGTHQEGTKFDTGVAEGAVSGAALGGLLGATGAALAATGVLAGPGAALLGTGPIVAALEGAVGGAAAGLEVGALTGLGFWTDEADIHADHLKRGGVVVAIPATHEHAAEARRIFAEAGADAVRG
jgi:hypothetical protein